MRADQVLSVLMDDKKYKARVEELKTLEARLSDVRQIAATLDVATSIKERAVKLEQELKRRQEELEESYLNKDKELRDSYKLLELQLAERAVKEREQYKDVRLELGKVRGEKEEIQKLQEVLEARALQVEGHERNVIAKEIALTNKIKRINEVFNG